MFLGTTFESSTQSLSNATAETSELTALTFTGLVLDEFYVTRDVLIKYNWTIPNGWDFNTILHAYFQNNTYGGNVAYSATVVDRIKIKKRFKGEFAWKTIHEKKITCADDFEIEFYDYYEPNHTDVEYAYVAVIGNTDTDVISTEVRSEFETYFICDMDETHPIIVDVDHQIQYNRESSTIISPGRKYPYVVHNGMAKYYSGTMTATFIEFDKDCHLNVDNAWRYRDKIDEFLTNGRAKILKSYDGQIWMVSVTGNISRTYSGFWQKISQSFDWVEQGNTNSIADLYDNGFINTDVDRED